MPDVLPDTFVVRILRVGGRSAAAGIGALVGPREVVTCAHVVNAALGLSVRAQEQPTDFFELDFPLLRTSSDAPGLVRRRAAVVRWFPPPREGAAGDDLACLELVDEPAPDEAKPARLIISLPLVGHPVRLFGYPGDPPRPDGAWVTSAVRGRVGGGRLQLDSGPESALRVQPGFSGGPVFDDVSGRVVGLLASAQPGRAAERDSYAITADQLRLAWPEVLDPHRLSGGVVRTTLGRGARGELTILHVSDIQFGQHHLFGGNGLTQADRDHDTLFSRLHDDLSGLAKDHGLRPDLMVVTGDLAEWGLRTEFERVTEFLAALCEAVEVPRRHVAIVPGNHDINQKSCEAYFLERESDEKVPAPPYWPKWRQFAAAFEEFYADVPVTFMPDEPWTLFEMPELSVVVAGLNSTMAESHRDGDHYGQVGEHQLRWFASRLEDYRRKGWLRLAAVHHNVVRGAVLDDENLRDADDLDWLLGQSRLANLLLHGHTHDGRLQRLGSDLPVLSTGSAAVRPEARPAEVPNQYQLVTVRPHGFTQYARQYVVGQRRWIGDNRINPNGSEWQTRHAYVLRDVYTALPLAPSQAPVRPGPPGDGVYGRKSAEPREDFTERVAEATKTRFPEATVTVRRDGGYLRVSCPLPGGGAAQWPVGIAENVVNHAVLDGFLKVHAQFASVDPSVPSEVVYGGPPAADELIEYARKGGVRLRSFVDYQGLLDLRPLIGKQRERLANDQLYPAGNYITQRFREQGGQRDDIRTGLIEQAISWLSAENSRFIMVLGDFGRGKTAFLRQLTRTIPAELPTVQPVLVELRSLEKAPTVDELLAQHLFRQGVEDISPAKLRYMIRSGRLVLLFDGFDELELRVGYDNAAEYLSTLLGSVAERAKVVLTSRTQHFQSDSQVRTALGQKVAAAAGSRVVVLEDFSEEQVLQFLTNIYDGDTTHARARFDLLGEIEDLLGLARNPRMLSFIADLDDERLLAIQRQEGKISAAELYREIVNSWLIGEAKRQEHKRGLQHLDERDRLIACTALALRLWESLSPTIALAELSAEVSATLTQLTERGFTGEQASHSIGSGSLLVRTENGMFAFVHQSIMEWLIADAASQALRESGSAPILTTRRMSRLMIEFFIDLAGNDVAFNWAVAMLADFECAESATLNALAVLERTTKTQGPEGAGSLVEHLNLAAIDLRSQDLNGRDLRGAMLRRANLRGMRLEDTDLSGADLSDADLTGVRMIRGSLRGAVLDGSRWDRAALLGTDGLDELGNSSELLTAAVVGRDSVEFMTQPYWFSPGSLGFSPDGALLAVVSDNFFEIFNIIDARPIRILTSKDGAIFLGAGFSRDGILLAICSGGGIIRIWDVADGTTRATLQDHCGGVWSVAFSPDGTLLATACDDRSIRIWDVATGTVRARLQSHNNRVRSVAFSPDGTVLATAANGGTARIWDVTAGTVRTTLQGHDGGVWSVAFSPDGALLATASSDGTARIWDVVAGTVRATLQGHDTLVRSVAFSPDGALLATASDDRTARIWDVAAGTVRATLQGHNDRVRGLAFSPDSGLLATDSDDRTARIWDVAAGTTRATLQGHKTSVWSVAFSPDGALLATAGHDGTARIWDVALGTPQATLRGHDRVVRGVAFSPDGAVLATVSDDRTARIWDVTGTLRATLEGHHDSVWGVAFSPDGVLLATASSDGTARIWDVAAGTTRATLQGHGNTVRSVAFSPDGAVLATASDDRTARIWDVTGTLRATLQGHEDTVRSVAFSPDGVLLATASNDCTVRIWDVATATTRATLQGHNDWLQSVAFSPDGTHLATASDDRTARIWDIATGTSRVILVPLPDGGYAAITDSGYKLEGEVAGRFWWAVKLCRFDPGELDGFVPGLKRLPADAPIFPDGLGGGPGGGSAPISGGA